MPQAATARPERPTFVRVEPLPGLRRRLAAFVPLERAVAALKAGQAPDAEAAGALILFYEARRDPKRWRDFQIDQAFRAEVAADPVASIKEVARRVARAFKVSARTVQRRFLEW